MAGGGLKITKINTDIFLQHQIYKNGFITATSLLAVFVYGKQRSCGSDKSNL